MAQMSKGIVPVCGGAVWLPCLAVPGPTTDDGLGPREALLLALLARVDDARSLTDGANKADGCKRPLASPA